MANPRNKNEKYATILIKVPRFKSPIKWKVKSDKFTPARLQTIMFLTVLLISLVAILEVPENERVWNFLGTAIGFVAGITTGQYLAERGSK